MKYNEPKIINGVPFHSKSESKISPSGGHGSVIYNPRDPSKNFKIGDIVKTIPHPVWGSKDYTGRIDTIINIRDFEPAYKLKDIDKWVCSGEIELETKRKEMQDLSISDNQKADDMEEKELNLGELIKDCIGQTFFHPRYGDVTIAEVTENFIELRINDGGTINTPARDCIHPTGMAFLYPDAESLKKYPFDGLVAWQEWSETRKPKRWRAKKYQGYYYIDCVGGRLVALYDTDEYDKDENNRYESYNYFLTKEEAQQAAEEVRKCLESFHNRKEGEK